eukprot:gene12606-biopygen3447
MPDTIQEWLAQEWHARRSFAKHFWSILEHFEDKNHNLFETRATATGLRTLGPEGSHRWTCPRHARAMPAPRPRHPSQKWPIARATPAPRPRHCPHFGDKTTKFTSKHAPQRRVYASKTSQKKLEARTAATGMHPLAPNGSHR